MFSSGSWARRYDDANSFAHEENKGGKIGRRMALKEMDSPTIESTAKQHSESMFRSSNNNQDEKSARILALLRSKDEALMQAQAKYEQERKRTSELRSELDKQMESLTETEEKLKNVQEKFQEHRRVAARDKESDAQKIRQLEGQVHDVEKEKFEAASKVIELEGAQKELKARLDSTLEVQEQVSTLTSALEAADELIGDLQEAVSQAKETSVIKDQEIEVLRGQIMSLIGEDGHGSLPSNVVKTSWIQDADEALSKPLAGENDGVADVDRLQERIQDLECQLEAANNMKLSVEERCNKLESLLHEEQSALKETQNQLELLQQQAQVSRRSKESEVEGLLRECSTLKGHLLEAQQENDNLKSSVWDLERRFAKQTATLVALEAANTLQSQWRLANFQGDSRFEIEAKHSPASISELSNQIQTMALNTIDLQRQLEDAEAKIVINHRQMEHLHKSLERYRMLASGMASDQVSSSPLDNYDENRRGVDEVEELHEMVHNLRERLVHSAAAQEGQAKAFTALVKELAERESILQRKLQDASTVHQHLKSLQSLCSKTIGMMHGTIGQMALEEGNEDQANAILQASTHWSMLGETTSDLLRKFQALSEKLNETRLRGAKDAGKTVFETLPSMVPGHMTVEAVFMDQLDSILYLVAEIRDFFPSTEAKRSQQHESTDTSIAAFVGERAQLILEMAETMKSSMKALRKHYAGKTLVKHGDADVVTQVLSGDTRDSQQDTIEDLVRQIAVLTERASLVSAAHEAALEEASHYQEALEHLKEAQSKFESREEEWKLEIENLKSQLKCIESAASSDNRATTSTSNTANDACDKVDKVVNIKDAGDLVALLDGLDSLLTDAARMEERLLTLEASLAAAERLEKETQVTSNYSRLVSSALRAKQVAAVWKEWQEELNAVHKIVSHKDRLLQDLEAEKDTLLDQVKALQLQQESQQQRHVQEIAAAEAKAAQDRQKLHAELTEAVAATTASAVEQRLIAQFEESMSILKKGLEAARVQCAELRSQKDKIYAEFVRYKEVKQAEIGLLEERLGILGGVESSQENIRFCTDDEQTTSLKNEIARACNSDAVSAALREASLERMHRRKVEEMLKIAMISKEESKVQRQVGLSVDATNVSDIFDSKNMLSFR